MINSIALERVILNAHPSSGPRKEGIYLSLNDLRALVDFLESDTNATSQNINHVAFMIGKISKGRSRINGPRNPAMELTVESLPFRGEISEGSLSGAEFMTGSKVGITEPILGFLEIAGHPFDNMEGGGGGNQKTPPPSTP